MGESELPNLVFTPFYDQKLFDVFKYIKEKTPLNQIDMSIKEWNRFLLETKMTKRVLIDGDNM